MIHKINDFVIGHYPQDVLDLIKPSVDGPWIAGGSSLTLFNGQPVDSDIDVFFQNQDQYQKAFGHIYDWQRRNTPVADLHQTDNAATITVAEKYGSTKRYKIQLIKKKFSPTFKDLLNDFDITVCQIGTDGTDWFATEQCLQDVDAKALRIRKVDGDTIRRAIKYWSRGYEPCPESWDMLVSNGEWVFEAGDYDGNY